MGTTKTGKPNYDMGRKLTGAPLDELPERYEIWERPEAAHVYLRKAKSSAIIASERELVRDAIKDN